VVKLWVLREVRPTTLVAARGPPVLFGIGGATLEDVLAVLAAGGLHGLHRLAGEAEVVFAVLAEPPQAALARATRVADVACPVPTLVEVRDHHDVAVGAVGEVALKYLLTVRHNEFGYAVSTGTEYKTNRFCHERLKVFAHGGLEEEVAPGFGRSERKLLRAHSAHTNVCALRFFLDNDFFCASSISE
jgi:hypothetical protein